MVRSAASTGTRVQFVAEKGEVSMRTPPDKLAAWSTELLRRLEVARRQAEILAEHKARAQDV